MKSQAGKPRLLQTDVAKAERRDIHDTGTTTTTFPLSAGSPLLVLAVAAACLTGALGKTLPVAWSRDFSVSDPSKGVFNATCGKYGCAKVTIGRFAAAV